ncbi:GDSL esterase/lipase At1g29670-like [Nymphaea colorata]|nr:GDSL esterase/lipase At1g29670-like [Nymphaea colorata]XP_031487430.1 GDSL esterase/lipase At1g29670-like [Nymphaea colorata]
MQLRFFSVLFLIFIFFAEHLTMLVAGSDVRAMFIFGDSIVDTGNNDFLDTNLKMKYYPYGIDFPFGPTGRATNARNPADILGELLGLPPFLPVFYDPLTKGSSVLAGVNYASVGSGVLDSTNQDEDIVPLSHQITNFQKATLSDLRSQLNGSSELSSYLSQSIFLVSSGAVDYLSDCFESGQINCNLEEFTELLVGNFTEQLKRLYESGARKFVVLNTQPIGCRPSARQLNNGSCVKAYNDASIVFNNVLRVALDELSEEVPGFMFSYVDMFGIVSSMIDDPATYGLKVINESCCVKVKQLGNPKCEEGVEPCADRRSYAYYDATHPTETVYRQICERAYASQLISDVYPFNVKHIASLRSEYFSTSLSLSSKPWANDA